jgi:hypothetical protein
MANARQAGQGWQRWAGPSAAVRVQPTALGRAAAGRPSARSLSDLGRSTRGRLRLDQRQAPTGQRELRQSDARCTAGRPVQDRRCPAGRRQSHLPLQRDLGGPVVRPRRQGGRCGRSDTYADRDQGTGGQRYRDRLGLNRAPCLGGAWRGCGARHRSPVGRRWPGVWGRPCTAAGGRLRRSPRIGTRVWAAFRPIFEHCPVGSARPAAIRHGRDHSRNRSLLGGATSECGMSGWCSGLFPVLRCRSA